MSKNKLTGTTIVNPNVEGMVPLPAKITTIGSNDEYTLLDAFNIDWNGYKMGNEEFSYTGDVLSYIKTQLDSKATTSSFDDFTDSFTRNSQVILYNTTGSKTTYPTKIENSIEWVDNIFINSIGDPDTTYGWRYNTKDTESNPYVWMASMTYTETFRNNAWEIGNFHDMSSYILLSGESGINGNFKSTVFVRTNSTPLAPKTGAVYDTGLPTNRSVYVQLIPREISIFGKQWSDGIPSGPEILWASTAIISAENPAAAQWTTPRQMTDTETYDVEFSPLESEYGNPTNNPNNWYDPQDALPEGITWEDMIWRAERTCVNGEWTAWIIVKIKGERGYVGKPADYYEQRWTITNDIQTPNTPSNAEVGVDDNVWKLTPQYESGKITWLTSRKVIYRGNPGEYEAIYDGEWSTPMRMNGIDGVSNPIQPVLKYYWHTDYSTAPSCNTSEQIPNVNGETIWAESPGNPHDSYIYLWMIQGQRHEGHMMDLDDSSAVSYWTAPVCLSGKNGEPGVDGSDIEFIYKRFTNVHEFTNDNPASWYTSSSINKPTEEWTGGGNNYRFAYVNSYLGPVEQGWTDHPQGITNVYKYEYATYRKTHDINGESYWGVFNTPFAWSVYGENGLDGDGVEYIYTTTATNESPTKPNVNVTTFNDAQSESGWGVGKLNGNLSGNGDTTWHDDPQNVNNEYQKFQWVSTRKFKTITNNNYTSLIINGGPIITIESSTGYLMSGATYLKDKNNKNLKVGDKAWFPYSTPELWNWYVNDGTNADEVVMIYQRNNSGTEAPTVPTPDDSSYVILTDVNASRGAWAENPGNSTTGYEYLWMTSAHCSYKESNQSNRSITYYTISDSWQTPVCLTGEPGNDGADGTDIEFIYFRTGEDNVTFNNGWDNFAGDSTQADWPFVETQESSYYIIDGVKTLLNQDHDTWSDNPFGVTSTYDYEYASIRKKTNKVWGDFCKPFLWSKYGEDGVDGDGVEYIYYCPETTTLIDWTNSNYNNINPSLWDATTSDFQASEYYVSPWTDDPQEVSENYKYEYVSQRKKRKITDSNKSNFDSAWTTGNSFTKNGQTYNIGDMAWFPYSVPALWANYAKDGLATNLVLESDNDNVTVGIDSNGLVNNNYQDTTTFRLVYNTRPLTLSSDYTLNMFNPDNNLFDLSNNILSFKSSSEFSGTFAVLNGNTLTISVPEGFDMNEYDNILPITFTATIINNSINGLDYNTTAVFTLKITAVELTLNDIYKLNIDKLVVAPNANNDGYETLNISLKSLTSTNSITTKNDADNNNLKVYYRPYRLKTGEDTSGQNNQVTNFSNVLLNFSYIKHEFELKYNNGSNEISLDIENVSAVFDGEKGNPGTDSKSQEYIYFLCDELNKEFTGNENPVSWSTNQNYQTDDYPFIGTDRANVLNNDWTDNPQGIDETHRYEYISTRSYDTSNETWGAFSKPVIWANWGHSGEDGDGVEYIYYLTNEENKVFDLIENPSTWTEDIDYQESEYIRNNTGWQDNPSGVSDENRYEYVSVRKYNKGNILNDNDNSNQEYKHRFPINYWSGTITPKNTTSMAPYHDPSKLYDYSYDKILGGNMGNGRFDASRIDINKAMHDFISILWNYVYDISINKPWGENASYPINAYEMLLVLTFYNYKFINEQEQSDLLNEGINNNIESLLYIRNNYNINTDINDVLSNYFNKLINKGYLILCRTNNSGAHVNIFNENSTLTFANKTYNIKGYNNYYVIKQWTPYSAPALWSSYGTPGAPGASGGSGLTIDFDNPSMQIAVNSTGYIKDNQTVTTYLNLYEGTQHINNQYVSLSINNGPDAFKHQYSSSDKFGYTLHNSGNYTYYTWTIGDIDTGNDGTIDSDESSQYYNELKLEDNAQLSFNISYNGNNYTKNINLVPIQYGNDGADAETFELHCAYSTIHYNRMLDTPSLEPSSVQYKIKHTSKNGVEFITLPDDDFTNFTISYSLVYENDNVTSGREGSSGRTPSSSVTTNNGIINIPSNILNTLTQVNVQLKHDSNVWDEDILEVVYDGVNGVDGDGTEYIYYRSQEPVEWVAYVSGSNDDNNVNPSYWTPNGENGSSDYIPTPYKNILWFDHPQGVDSSYVWEYVSQRQYNGLKNTWERYTSPITWSHYGETGRDGDGVEYIYQVSSSTNPQEVPQITGSNWHDYQTTPEFGTGPRSDWKDNPSGVGPNSIYEYVSVRKYKELTDDNKSELTELGILGIDEDFLSSYIGKNVWFPYSEPKLWSKYGRDGQASAVTMDNDNENIAVIINNSNNVVRTISNITYFNMYDNLNEVQFSLSAPAGFTYSNSGAASTYWSSENSYYVNFGFVANQNIPNGRITYSFTGNYIKNGTSYSRTSNVSIIGIKEADVPTLYQLRPTAKVVKWDGTTDNSYVPNVIYSYVSYIENGENQIITSYSTNKFGREKLRLFYNGVELSGNFIPGTELGYFIKNKANTLPLKIDLKYGSNNVLLDSETITLVSDGKKGDDGNPGADAITLDFTNDQINLAVDGDGYIKPNQEKITYLVIYPSNVIIDNITVTCDTNKINVINNQFGSQNDLINLTYSKDTSIAKYTININISSDVDVQIPENGLDIEFEISLNDGTELLKTLKICGQHNGEDGENAVTYEIVPTVNAINYSSSTPTLSYYVNKYDGSNIAQLSSDEFSSYNLCASWTSSNSSDVSYMNSLTESSGIYNQCSGGGQIYLKLWKGSQNSSDAILLDTETIPVLKNGNNGAAGSQGFTGPIVRMRGEYVHNSNTQYGNGEYNRSTNGYRYNGTSPLYVDIVTYTNNNGTKYYTPKTNVSGSYMSTDSSYLCKGSYFISKEYPTKPNGTLNEKWTEATQYDFIATKLLYADQALVNQLSTHDLIVTNSTGVPVAGMTSGRTAMTDANGQIIQSPLTQNLGTGWSAGHSVENSSTDPVRIFAGNIQNGTNYSLTNAPFRVTQSGVAYMEAAVVEGTVTADKLLLGLNSFAILNEITIQEALYSTSPGQIKLPKLSGDKAQVFYVYTKFTNYPFTTENNNSGSYKPGIWTQDGERNNGYSWNHPDNHKYMWNCSRILPANNTLLQFIGIGGKWNIIETTLAPEDSGDTIYNPKYYDVTADVTLIGYNYSNGGWYDMSTVDAPTPKIDYGDNYVTIDFYTYLSMDESLVQKNGGNYDAYADLGKLFGWFNN